MFFTIAGKELRNQILSVRFHISLILIFILLVSGTVVLIYEHARQVQDMNPYVSEAFYVDYGSKYWLNRHIPALRILSAGLGANISLRCSNTIWVGPMFISDDLVGNPLRFLFPAPDFPTKRKNRKYSTDLTAFRIVILAIITKSAKVRYKNENFVGKIG